MLLAVLGRYEEELVLTELVEVVALLYEEPRDGREFWLLAEEVTADVEPFTVLLLPEDVLAVVALVLATLRLADDADCLVEPLAAA